MAAAFDADDEADEAAELMLLAYELKLLDAELKLERADELALAEAEDKLVMAALPAEVAADGPLVRAALLAEDEAEDIALLKLLEYELRLAAATPVAEAAAELTDETPSPICCLNQPR